MQSNDLRADTRALWPKKIAFWLKLGLLSLILAYVAYQLTRQPLTITAVWQQLRKGTGSPGWGLALAGLMPINWGLEARKWQLLIRRVVPQGFGEAYRGVLAGASLGFVLPVLAGDAAGRLLSLPGGQRAGALGASLVSGGLQFLAALLVGTVAWLYYLRLVPARHTGSAVVLAGLLGAVLLASLVAALGRHRLRRWVTMGAFQSGAGMSPFCSMEGKDDISAPLWNATVTTAPTEWVRTLTPYVQLAGHYTNAELATAFGLALLRHLLFSAQFYLALRLYGIDLAIGPMLSGIGVIFLVKTITPAFTFLSDLGVREAAALWVFSPFGVSAPLLLTATLTLWLTNVLTPVLVGLVAVWQLRLTIR